MEPNFGQPKAKDPTSWMERIVREEAAAFHELLNVEGPQVINRPIGSVKKPIEAQVADYQQSLYSGGLVEMHAQMVSQYGSMEAARAPFMEYVNKMRKAAGDGSTTS